jgi:Flp pilus assembly pilin Flp
MFSFNATPNPLVLRRREAASKDAPGGANGAISWTIPRDARPQGVRKNAPLSTGYRVAPRDDAMGFGAARKPPRWELSFIARLARDEDGGPLVEVALILPMLILFLFGGIDFMNALYQWNAAAKAVEIGARIAAVSDPIASGLTSIANEAVSPGLASGGPMPDVTVECDGGAAVCACTSGACDGMGAYSAEAMALIVYGRSGNSGCTPPASQYFAGMCNLHPAIGPQYVTVVYKQTGLGYAGRSLGPVPTITVSLNAASSKTKLRFRFFFLPFAMLAIPQVTTTMTGEALSASAAD